MSLENGNNMVMPVGPMPMYGYGNVGNGGSWGSEDGWWIILLLLAFGGWGNGFGGFGGGGNMQLGYDFPWLLNANNQTDNLVSNGFQNAQLANQLTGIQSAVTSGFGDVATQLCGGFAGVNATVNGAQNAITSQMYNNTIADLERSFAAQTASMQGMNALQSQLAQCCCDNRAATNDLKYTVATEACADRAAVNDALRDVLTANTASTQRILDQMCQDKIDAKNEKIAELQNQLTMAELRANNNQQTQTLLTDNLAQTNALEQYLAPVPRPAYIVQNPNCCYQQTACGCGM